MRRIAVGRRVVLALALAAGGALVQGAPRVAAQTATPTCDGKPATIVVSAPGMTTMGTSGDDVIVGTTGPDTILGGGGNDTICGLGGDDVLVGGSGNDRIFGGPGNDSINGG